MRDLGDVRGKRVLVRPEAFHAGEVQKDAEVAAQVRPDGLRRIDAW